MEIINIVIIFILTIIIIYLIYKTRNLSENLEKFTPTQTDINQMIATTYKVDLEAMRNLAQITQKIHANNDTLILPTDITIPGELILNGKAHFISDTETKGTAFIDGDLGVYGDVKVTGNVTFNNKNTNIMEIFPRLMIIIWLGNIEQNRGQIDRVPKGWALCDGNFYKIGPDGYAIVGGSGDLKTPDLRGRFTVGAGLGTSGNTNMGLYPLFTDKKLGDTGGSESHTLTILEMPAHSHSLGGYISLSGSNDSGNINMYRSGASTSETGGSQPHNNMPPWHAVNYIMKL
jgi:microcystin-dependent protein